MSKKEEERGDGSERGGLGVRQPAGGVVRGTPTTTMLRDDRQQL